MSDYYRILGVSKDASREEIQRAFRRLAREHHPDVGGEATGEEFRRIREAYEVLSNPERRAAYDASRDRGVRIQVRRKPVQRTAPRSPGIYEVRSTSGYQDIREVFNPGKAGGPAGAYDPFDELDRLILAWLRRWTW